MIIMSACRNKNSQPDPLRLWKERNSSILCSSTARRVVLTMFFRSYVYILTLSHIGIFEAYFSSGSEVDDSNVTADTSNLAPESVHPHESQALVQPRDKQPLRNLTSSTAEQESTAQTAFDDDAETITAEENAREAQEARTVNTGSVIDSHAVPDQKLNATPIKLEDDETAHTGENTASGTWLTGQGREYAQRTRNIATSNSTMVSLSPTGCQDLLTRIRVAEVSSLDLNKFV